MTTPLSAPTQHQRPLGPAFDAMATWLVLVGAPSAVGKTCLSLNLAAHFAAHLGELVLYVSPASPKEVILTRLAKNLTPEGQAVDPGVVSRLPLVVLDNAEPTSASVLENAMAFVEQHGQPGLVLVNDLQNLRPAKEGLVGLEAAIEIMADLRAVAKLCDAPVVLLSQLSPGKGVSSAVAAQADRVVTVALESEDPDHKVLAVRYYDPPEPAGDSYPLVLTRATGVLTPGA